MIKNPRRLDGVEIKPVSLSIDLNITPLSTATMTLAEGQTIDPRTYIELFTASGSVGVFRTRSPGQGVGQTSSIPLDHAITEVNDYIINDESETESTVGAALTALWTNYKGSKWQLGSVSNSSSAVTLKYDHDNVLDAILDVLEQVPSLYLSFDFSTSPWTVNVIQRDATVTAEGRITRNVKSANVTQDDKTLCTRVYMEYLSGTSGNSYGYIDADTIGTYGLIEHELTGAQNAAQATRIATTYLEKHKRPQYSVQINAVDLSRITGETLDSFAIGRKYRLAIPKYGVTVEETITEIKYADIYTDDVTITLSEPPDQVINYINRATKTGRANGKRITSNEKRWHAEFYDHDVKIGMVIGEYQGQNFIKAGEIALAINETTGEATALIDAAHVNISAGSTAHVLAGSIVYDEDGNLVLKESIGGGVLVEHNDQGTTATFGVWDRGNLTGGVMVQQINGDTTTHITGDRINISATNTVQTLAGAMEKDANGHLVIKDGAGFRLRKTSGQTTSEFGVWDEGNLTAGVIVQKINGESSAQITADHINISGTSTVQTLAGAMEKDANGHLVIKDGAGFRLRKTSGQTTAEYGVWDEGNLTGGVIVNKINGDTTTYITGDRINISATNTVQTLAGAMEKDSSGNLIIKDGAGFRLRRGSGSSVAEYGVWDQGNLTAGVIVQKINGGTNVSINADKVTITGETKINGAFEINSSGYLNVKKTAVFQGNLTLTTANSEITSPNYVMNSGGHFRFIGGNTGEYYDLTTTKLKDMVKSFSVSGNVLTLTPWYGDPVTFSKAVSLSGAWGSGNDVGKYVVTASENGETVATHKYEPPMRLMGGSPPTTSFSAEITSTSGSTTVAQKSIYGYLQLKGTTSGSYVEVNTNPSGTGSTVAMLPVGTLYTDGQDSVTLKNPYWNSVQSVTTMRTVTVETNGRPTSLSKSQTIAMDVGTWSSGLIPVYVKDTNTSGSVVAQTSVSIPNVTSVTLGSVSSGTVYNCGVDIGGITKQSTVDCSTPYSDGNTAVTLTNPSWNQVTTATTMRTVTVETSGRSTKLSKSKTVYLTTASAWDGGMMGIYIRDGSTSGTAVATSSVSIPNVTSVSLGSISSGAVCNCGVTIGGTTKQSTVDCSGKLYPKTGTNKVTANGTITPPSGYIGFSSVEVDVAGGGGGAITWDAYDPNDNVHNTAHSGSNTSTILLNGRNFNAAGPDNVATAGRSYWYVQIGSESGTILCKDYIDIPAITATCSNPSQGTYLITVKCGGKTKQFYLELTNSYSGGYNFNEA